MNTLADAAAGDPVPWADFQYLYATSAAFFKCLHGYQYHPLSGN